MEDQGVIKSDDIKNRLKQISINYDLDLLILFGSRAKGNFKNTSDWDLAFIKYDDLSLDNEMNLRDELENIFKGKSYDLIDLKKNCSVVLRYNIFRYGICIHESKKGVFLREKEFSYFDYIDSLHLLKPTKKKFLNR